MRPSQDSRFDELANAPFSENRPTSETAKFLEDELLFQRATKSCSACAGSSNI